MDKAKLVDWHVKGEEYYSIIAESIEEKEELRNQGFMVYDLANTRKNLNAGTTEIRFSPIFRVSSLSREIT